MSASCARLTRGPKLRVRIRVEINDIVDDTIPIKRCDGITVMTICLRTIGCEAKASEIDLHVRCAVYGAWLWCNRPKLQSVKHFADDQAGILCTALLPVNIGVKTVPTCIYQYLNWKPALGTECRIQAVSPGLPWILRCTTSFSILLSNSLAKRSLRPETPSACNLKD